MKHCFLLLVATLALAGGARAQTPRFPIPSQCEGLGITVAHQTYTLDGGNPVFQYTLNTARPGQTIGVHTMHVFGTDAENRIIYFRSWTANDYSVPGANGARVFTLRIKDRDARITNWYLQAGDCTVYQDATQSSEYD